MKIVKVTCGSARSAGDWRRLEGDRFVSFTTADGLPSDAVTAIADDGRGRLWIGTNEGIAIWDGRRLSTPEGVEHLAGCAVRAILCTHDDVVWVGTYRKGLFTFERGKWSESDADMLLGPGRTCYALLEDRAGRIWASTDHETVLRRDRAGWTRCRVQCDPPGRTAHVQAFADDVDGNIWCALPQGNLNYFRAGHDDIEGWKLTTPNSEVGCVVGDPAGGIWIGTEAAGLLRLTVPNVSALGQAEGLAIRSVHTVAEPEPGILWAGTRGAGAFRLVDGTFRSVEVVGAPYDSHYANVICPSPDGSCWLGTAKGLYQFREGRRVGGGEYDSVIGKDSVLAMIEDRRGGFWVGTSLGRVLHLSRDILRMTDINTHGHGNMSLRKPEMVLCGSEPGAEGSGGFGRA